MNDEQQKGCELSAEDRSWIEGGIAGWRRVVRDLLFGSDPKFPLIVTYDAGCTYTLVVPPEGRAEWSYAKHSGEIILPDGAKIPASPTAMNVASFEGSNVVVISLPSIWRPVAPRSEIPLDHFLEGILFHELSHAYQAQVTPNMSFPALAKSFPALEHLSDDSVQDEFKANTTYVQAYETERDLLYSAASAADRRQARALACKALGETRLRRQTYLVGSYDEWSLIDDVSLTTEGLGQWLSYKWLTDVRGLPSSLVLARLRSPYWSQDQGLAIFLTVDRLVLDWQRILFASSMATATDLLALSCRPSHTVLP